jgi:hypothetical protein
MSLEALQAQAGQRWVASAQLYLHLGDDWLAQEYRRAVEAMEAQAAGGCRDERHSTRAVVAVGRDRGAGLGPRSRPPRRRWPPRCRPT